MILSVSVYASHGASEGVSIPAKPSNDGIYYYPLPIDYNITQPANETSQSTTTNATIRPKDGTTVTPQPSYPQKVEPTISTHPISEEGQICC